MVSKQRGDQPRFIVSVLEAKNLSCLVPKGINEIQKPRKFVALGLQYLLLAGTVAAFIGGASILGGKGGVIGAAIGTLTVNFLNTGLVFNVTPAFMVQLYLGILLIVVIMFQTGSRIFEDRQRRGQLLEDVDRRRSILADKIARLRKSSG